MRFLLVLFALLLATPSAWAASWAKCTGLSGTSQCYSFTDADTTHESTAVVLKGITTVILAPAGAARVHLRGPCVAGTVSDDNCPRLLVDLDGDGVKDDTPMDGASGSSGHTGIHEVPAGVYFLEITTAAGSSEAPQVMFYPAVER